MEGELPGPLAGLLEALTGSKWFTADERLLAELEYALKRGATRLETEVPPLITSVKRRVRSSFDSQAAEFYEESIDKFTTGETNYVKITSDGLRQLAEFVGEVREQVAYTKRMIIGQLVQLLVEIKTAILMAKFTFGASLTTIPLLKRITSLAIQRLINFLITQLLAHTTYNTALALALDQLIQRNLVALGIADGNNDQFTLDAVVGGALDGVAGGFLNKVSDKVADVFGNDFGDIINLNLNKGGPDPAPPPGVGRGLGEDTPLPPPRNGKDVPDGSPTPDGAPSPKGDRDVEAGPPGGQKGDPDDVPGDGPIPVPPPDRGADGGPPPPVGDTPPPPTRDAQPPPAGGGTRDLPETPPPGGGRNLPPKLIDELSHVFGRNVHDLMQPFGRHPRPWDNIATVNRFRDDMGNVFAKNFGDQIGRDAARNLGRDYADAFTANWGRHEIGDSLAKVLDNAPGGPGGRLTPEVNTFLSRDLPDGVGRSLSQFGEDWRRMAAQWLTNPAEGAASNVLGEGLSNMILTPEHEFKVTGMTAVAGVTNSLIAMGGTIGGLKGLEALEGLFSSRPDALGSPTPPPAMESDPEPVKGDSGSPGNDSPADRGGSGGQGGAAGEGRPGQPDGRGGPADNAGTDGAPERVDRPDSDDLADDAPDTPSEHRTPPETGDNARPTPPPETPGHPAPPPGAGEHGSSPIDTPHAERSGEGGPQDADNPATPPRTSVDAPAPPPAETPSDVGPNRTPDAADSGPEHAPPPHADDPSQPRPGDDDAVDVPILDGGPVEGPEEVAGPPQGEDIGENGPASDAPGAAPGVAGAPPVVAMAPPPAQGGDGAGASRPNAAAPRGDGAPEASPRPAPRGDGAAGRPDDATVVATENEQKGTPLPEGSPTPETAPTPLAKEFAEALAPPVTESTDPSRTGTENTHDEGLPEDLRELYDDPPVKSPTVSESARPGDPRQGKPPRPLDLSPLIDPKGGKDRPRSIEEAGLVDFRDALKDVGAAFENDQWVNLADRFDSYAGDDGYGGYDDGSGGQYPPGTRVSQYPTTPQYSTATYDDSGVAYDDSAVYDDSSATQYQRSATPTGETAQAHDERAALLREWNRSFDGVEDLVATVQLDVADQRMLVEDGNDGNTELMRFENGVRAVYKDTEGTTRARERADAEQLASLVGGAIGANVPGVLRVGEFELFMHFMDGASGFTHLDNPRSPLYTTWDGHVLGLLDLLIANGDRSPGNWLDQGDGRVAGIDHAQAWKKYSDPPEEPTDLGELAYTDGMRPFYDFDANRWIRNPLTRDDIRWLRPRLARLFDDFEHLGRTAWFGEMMERFDMLARNARGTTSLLAENSGGGPSGHRSSGGGSGGRDRHRDDRHRDHRSDRHGSGRRHHGSGHGGRSGHGGHSGSGGHRRHDVREAPLQDSTTADQQVPDLAAHDAVADAREEAARLRVAADAAQARARDAAARGESEAVVREARAAAHAADVAADDAEYFADSAELTVGRAEERAEDARRAERAAERHAADLSRDSLSDTEVEGRADTDSAADDIGPKKASGESPVLPGGLADSLDGKRSARPGFGALRDPGKNDEQPRTAEKFVADLTYRYQLDNIGNHTAEDGQTEVFLADRHRYGYDTDGYAADPGRSGQYQGTDDYDDPAETSDQQYPAGTQVSQYPTTVQYSQYRTETYDDTAATYDAVATYDDSAATYYPQPAAAAEESTQAQDDRVALLREWNRSFAGVEDLVDATASDVVGQETLNAEGNDGRTELMRFENGMQAVYKDTEETIRARDRADAEQLASLVGRAIGANVPGVLRIGEYELFMHFMHGASGFTHLDNPQSPLTTTWDGHVLGLLDLLIANGDRNPGNWLDQGDGRVAGIDHGKGWFKYEDTPEDPTDLEGLAYTDGMRPFYDFDRNTWIRNPLTRADIRWMRPRLARLFDDFERLGRTEWFDEMMARFDMLARNARGTTGLLVEDSGRPRSRRDDDPPAPASGSGRSGRSSGSRPSHSGGKARRDDAGGGGGRRSGGHGTRHRAVDGAYDFDNDVDSLHEDGVPGRPDDAVAPATQKEQDGTSVPETAPEPLAKEFADALAPPVTESADLPRKDTGTIDKEGLPEDLRELYDDDPPAKSPTVSEPAVRDDPWQGKPPRLPDLSPLIDPKGGKDRPRSIEEAGLVDFRDALKDVGAAFENDQWVNLADRFDHYPYADDDVYGDGGQESGGQQHPPEVQISWDPDQILYSQWPNATYDASAATYYQQPAASTTETAQAPYSAYPGDTDQGNAPTAPAQSQQSAGSHTQAAPAGWHGSHDGIGDLVDSAQTGIAEQWDFHEGGGQDELTELVRFGDGTLAVHKVTEDTEFTSDPESNPEFVANERESARQRADAEQLASLVGRAIGADVPGVYRVGYNELYMHYMHGRSATDRLGGDFPELTGASGLRLGLLDVLIANTDRGPENLLYTGHGTVIGIDHGGGWAIEENEPYDPTNLGGFANPATMETYYDFANNRWIANPLTVRDVQWLEGAITALRPEFLRLGREGWYEGMRARLGMLARNARGTAGLLVADSGPPRSRRDDDPPAPGGGQGGSSSGRRASGPGGGTRRRDRGSGYGGVSRPRHGGHSGSSGPRRHDVSDVPLQDSGAADSQVPDLVGHDAVADARREAAELRAVADAAQERARDAAARGESETVQREALAAAYAAEVAADDAEYFADSAETNVSRAGQRAEDVRRAEEAVERHFDDPARGVSLETEHASPVQASDGPATRPIDSTGPVPGLPQSVPPLSADPGDLRQGKPSGPPELSALLPEDALGDSPVLPGGLADPKAPVDGDGRTGPDFSALADSKTNDERPRTVEDVVADLNFRHQLDDIGNRPVEEQVFMVRERRRRHGRDTGGHSAEPGLSGQYEGRDGYDDFAEGSTSQFPEGTQLSQYPTEVQFTQYQTSASQEEDGQGGYPWGYQAPGDGWVADPYGEDPYALGAQYGQDPTATGDTFLPSAPPSAEYGAPEAAAFDPTFGSVYLPDGSYDVGDPQFDWAAPGSGQDPDPGFLPDAPEHDTSNLLDVVDRMDEEGELDLDLNNFLREDGGLPDAPDRHELTDEQMTRAVGNIYRLSDREFDVLVALGAGRGDDEIKDLLGVEDHAFARLMGGVTGSLGVDDRDQVVAVAVAAGLTDDRAATELTPGARMDRALVRVRFLNENQPGLLGLIRQPDKTIARELRTTLDGARMRVRALVHRLGVQGRDEAADVADAAVAAGLVPARVAPVADLTAEQLTRAVGNIYRLSDREFDVLVALGAGRSDGDIATRFKLRVRGFAHLMGGVIDSLGVDGPGEAAAVAVAAGLTDDRAATELMAGARMDRALIRARFLDEDAHKLLGLLREQNQTLVKELRTTRSAVEKGVSGLVHRLGVEDRGEAADVADAIATGHVPARVAPGGELTAEQMTRAVGNIYRLSDREFDVLVALGAGRGDDDIKNLLDVEDHAFALLMGGVTGSLGVDGSEEAAAVARAAGLTDDRAATELTPGERMDRALIRVRFLDEDQRNLLVLLRERNEIVAREIGGNMNADMVRMRVRALVRRLGVQGRDEAADVADAAVAAGLVPARAVLIADLTADQLARAVGNIYRLTDGEFDGLVALGAGRSDGQIITRLKTNQRGFALLMGRVTGSLGVDGSEEAAAVARAAGLTDDRAATELTPEARMDRALIRVRFLGEEGRKLLGRLREQDKTIARGRTTRDVVKKRVSGLVRRLGVRNREEAIDVAVAAGLVPAAQEVPARVAPDGELTDEQLTRVWPRIDDLGDGKRYEVFRHLGDTQDIGEIAKRVKKRNGEPISKTTAADHVSRVVRTLRVGDPAAAGAVARAISSGWVPGRSSPAERGQAPTADATANPDPMVIDDNVDLYGVSDREGDDAGPIVIDDDSDSDADFDDGDYDYSGGGGGPGPRRGPDDDDPPAAGGGSSSARPASGSGEGNRRRHHESGHGRRSRHGGHSGRERERHRRRDVSEAPLQESGTADQQVPDLVLHKDAADAREEAARLRAVADAAEARVREVAERGESEAVQREAQAAAHAADVAADDAEYFADSAAMIVSRAAERAEDERRAAQTAERNAADLSRDSLPDTEVGGRADTDSAADDIGPRKSSGDSPVLPGGLADSLDGKRPARPGFGSLGDPGKSDERPRTVEEVAADLTYRYRLDDFGNHTAEDARIEVFYNEASDQLPDAGQVFGPADFTDPAMLPFGETGAGGEHTGDPALMAYFRREGLIPGSPSPTPEPSPAPNPDDAGAEGLPEAPSPATDRMSEGVEDPSDGLDPGDPGDAGFLPEAPATDSRQVVRPLPVDDTGPAPALGRREGVAATRADHPTGELTDEQHRAIGKLTDGEFDFFVALGRGRPEDEIRTRLKLTGMTFARARTIIVRSLGVNSPEEAAAVAQAAGLTDDRLASEMPDPDARLRRGLVRARFLNEKRRQLQLLSIVHKPNKVIGDERGASPATTKRDIGHLIHRLGVLNREEAAEVARAVFPGAIPFVSRAAASGQEPTAVAAADPGAMDIDDSDIDDGDVPTNHPDQEQAVGHLPVHSEGPPPHPDTAPAQGEGQGAIGLPAPHAPRQGEPGVSLTVEDRVRELALEFLKGLTPLQRTVLNLMKQGLASGDIRELLKLSTASHHIAVIRNHLGGLGADKGDVSAIARAADFHGSHTDATALRVPDPGGILGPDPGVGDGSLGVLAPSQRRILQLLDGDPRPPWQIAGALGVAPEEFLGVVAEIYGLLGVWTRTDATAIFRRALTEADRVAAAVARVGGPATDPVADQRRVLDVVERGLNQPGIVGRLDGDDPGSTARLVDEIHQSLEAAESPGAGTAGRGPDQDETLSDAPREEHDDSSDSDDEDSDESGLTPDLAMEGDDAPDRAAPAVELTDEQLTQAWGHVNDLADGRIYEVFRHLGDTQDIREIANRIKQRNGAPITEKWAAHYVREVVRTLKVSSPAEAGAVARAHFSGFIPGVSRAAVIGQEPTTASAAEPEPMVTDDDADSDSDEDVDLYDVSDVDSDAGGGPGPRRGSDDDDDAPAPAAGGGTGGSSSAPPVSGSGGGTGREDTGAGGGRRAGGGTRHRAVDGAYGLDSDDVALAMAADLRDDAADAREEAERLRAVAHAARVRAEEVAARGEADSVVREARAAAHAAGVAADDAEYFADSAEMDVSRAGERVEDDRRAARAAERHAADLAGDSVPAVDVGGRADTDGAADDFGPTRVSGESPVLPGGLADSLDGKRPARPGDPGKNGERPRTVEEVVADLTYRYRLDDFGNHTAEDAETQVFMAGTDDPEQLPNADQDFGLGDLPDGSYDVHEFDFRFDSVDLGDLDFGLPSLDDVQFDWDNWGDLGSAQDLDTGFIPGGFDDVGGSDAFGDVQVGVADPLPVQDPGDVGVLPDAPGDDSVPTRPISVTGLEGVDRTVAALAGEGLTVGGIAARTGIQLRTLYRHLGGMFARVGVGG
ncbi:hypothetical protein ACFOVU_09170, partial [Nocardiopsis sediminis]